MEDKEIYLSELVRDLKISEKDIEFINEQPFTCFARGTSSIDKPKCIFVGAIKYIQCIDNYTKMVITNRDTYEKMTDIKCGICVSDRPRDLFFCLMDEVERRKSANLLKTQIGKSCNISPLAYIADYGVVIGDGVTIEPFACIEPNTNIGDGSIICSGAKVGVQAFNLYDNENGRKRLFHGGKTIIGRNVLISQNVVVEQALYSYLTTRIGDNTKIDVNVIIGHNSNIGNNCEITGGSNIAGFVDVGNDTVIRLGVSVANGVRIGKNAHIGIGSVIVHNVKDYANMFGNPAQDLSRYKR